MGIDVGWSQQVQCNDVILPAWFICTIVLWESQGVLMLHLLLGDYWRFGLPFLLHCENVCLLVLWVDTLLLLQICSTSLSIVGSTHCLNVVVEVWDQEVKLAGQRLVSLLWVVGAWFVWVLVLPIWEVAIKIIQDEAVIHAWCYLSDLHRFDHLLLCNLRCKMIFPL